jgi:hypothetical protein
MFFFNGSMFPFLFRVLVTLISVYTFSVCYFYGFVTFDLNIFLHLIQKKTRDRERHKMIFSMENGYAKKCWGSQLSMPRPYLSLGTR